MRLVVDCRYTRIGTHDGISRYTARIVAALGRRHPLVMLISDHRQLELLPDLPWELVASPTSPLEPLIALTVNRLQPDVVFTPMQTMGGIGRRYRLVKTVHDLIYYRHRTPPRDLPGFVRLLWRLYHLAWWPQRLLLNGADAIAVVSDTTRELVAEHRLTSRPVTVVANAADPLDSAEAAAVAVRQAPTGVRELVYMGSFMPYKNVETVAAAAALLPGYRLHLMSRVGAGDRERLSALGGDLVFHDGASDEEYRQLLLRASALVTASRDEGFGIPLVEAMSLGTPVVVSDIPIFREIGGEAALYADPDSPESFARAIRGLEHPDEWSGRSIASRAQASRFDWEASADALMQLLTGLAP